MNSRELTTLSKELAAVQDIAIHYKKINSHMKELQDLIEIYNFEQVDMKELIQEDMDELVSQIVQTETDLLRELIPKDSLDSNNVILEVRAGTGGDEASLFAAEIVEMYQKYCIFHKWKTSLLSKIEENGMVKRVPATENQGRIHTSTVTVAVLPQVTNTEININPSDIKMDSYRASGKGGQNVNTTDSAVRLTHIPTGIVVENQEERSQLRNKEKAMKILYARIYDRAQSKIKAERRLARNSLIGSGDRSEKCRTYNFPQNRVTDHRISKSIHNIQGVMNGLLIDQFIDQLRLEYDLDKLSSFDVSLSPSLN
ncbi:Peptide chain release factor 1 [Smittium mucronatum]|uniref:Peptide chain release factor 1 n=1 Tax=Smittium mucronatum TaxID=133383 RepID=A0A1R0H076_9FUNG|nr:Peptide chain release factor 1 [Smittium mucronatum]